jgi:hypothetical protein
MSIYEWVQEYMEVHKKDEVPITVGDLLIAFNQWKENQKRVGIIVK